MHLGKMCSSELTPAAMQSTGSFLAITHMVVRFSCYSKYPNAKSSIQRHHVEFWHFQGTQGLEADEWIIIRYKYSIFNPDRYELVQIISLISCKRKQYEHWSTKEVKTWQISAACLRIYWRAFTITFTNTMGKVNVQNTVTLRKFLTSSEISDW